MVNLPSWELENKLFSTQNELLEITDVATRCEWECEEMRRNMKGNV